MSNENVIIFCILFYYLYIGYFLSLNKNTEYLGVVLFSISFYGLIGGQSLMNLNHII